MTVPGQCASTRLGGARCSLQEGHEGSHIQVEPNGVTGWANEPAKSWPKPQPADSEADRG